MGRIPLPRRWDALAGSAHKWGGPAGVGVLLVRKGARWRPPFPTDDRVDPRVAGFENVPAVLAAAAALQARVAERDELNRRDAGFAAQVRACLSGVPDVEVHGDPEARLPHLVSFSSLYVDGEALVGELDRRGSAVASGSACTASALEPSHVLVAMGALTHGNVRVTFSRSTTADDVEALCAALPQVVAGLRTRSGA
jgi:cysteine desulfurase